MNGRHDSGRDDGRPKIGLVLSGGGARGISHIGVFKGLEKYNIPIDLIVGTSMGSVIGGFYAAGYSANELEKNIRAIDWDNIFSDATERENLFMGQKIENDRYLINLRFEGLEAQFPSSLSSGQKILSIIADRLYKANFQALSNFDNLKIPFRSIATDLISGKRIVLSEGDLAEAINASVAVPLLFAPVRWNGMMLVDGGLSSNFAVDVARDLGIDVVIVIDITSPLRSSEELGAPWEIADQVTTIMMQSRYEEQLSLADIVIQPNLEGIGSTDFAKFDEMIERGEAAVESLSVQLVAATRLASQPAKVDTLEVSKFQQKYANSSIVTELHSDLITPKEHQVTLAMIRNDVDLLFAQGTINNINAHLTDTTLTYTITPNTNYNHLDITGNSIYPDTLLFTTLTHSFGQILNHNIICEDLKTIRDRYKNDGYFLTQYTGIDFDSTTGTLSVQINEGLIDSIKISGNDLTERFVILREFPLEQGDIFNANQVKLGIANIYNTQLFEKVNVTIDESEQGYDLTIKVIEKKYTVLRLGGKADLERGGQNYMELAHDNSLGIGGKFSILGRFGERDRAVSLNFRVDRLFRSFLTGGFHLYYNRQINPVTIENISRGEYVAERTGSRLSIGQQLRKLGQMSVELRWERAQIFRESGSFSGKQDSELRTITIRSVTDKRDRIGFTTKGTYNVWYWESGDQRFLGGQEKYTKAFINLEGYYTYWNAHTFHVKGVIGIGDKTLPFSEYFRIGGMQSFMGLHDYEYVGRQTIFANLEYRYKLPFQIVADTFIGIRYDIGSIWETPNLVLEGEDFFQGAGMWVGVDTFLGPLILGYGDASLRKGILYLSLGYNF
jgi:NTE family protein